MCSILISDAIIGGSIAGVLVIIIVIVLVIYLRKKKLTCRNGYLIKIVSFMVTSIVTRGFDFLKKNLHFSTVTFVIKHLTHEKLQDSDIFLRISPALFHLLTHRGSAKPDNDLAYICHANVSVAKRMGAEQNEYSDTNPKISIIEPYAKSGGKSSTAAQEECLNA